MATETEVLALHRYFIWANKMRTDFDALLAESQSRSAKHIETVLYMSLWYAQLYVVIEGWRELKLADASLDELLNSPNTDLLKRYRNGVCHFQKDYYDARFLEFMNEGRDSVVWVRKLNKEFGRWFLTREKNISGG